MGLRPIAESKIVNTLIKLKGSGLAESTLKRVSYELTRLSKHCVGSPEAKNFFANMSTIMKQLAVADLVEWTPILEGEPEYEKAEAKDGRIGEIKDSKVKCRMFLTRRWLRENGFYIPVVVTVVGLGAAVGALYLAWKKKWFK